MWCTCFENYFPTKTNLYCNYPTKTKVNMYVLYFGIKLSVQQNAIHKIKYYSTFSVISATVININVLLVYTSGHIYYLNESDLSINYQFVQPNVSDTGTFCWQCISVVGGSWILTSCSNWDITSSRHILTNISGRNKLQVIRQCVLFYVSRNGKIC